MDKFGRRYELTVKFRDGSETKISLPFTLQVDITRTTLTSNNICQLRIFNLGLLTRNKIRKNGGDYGNYIQIILRAGYGQNLPQIFKGNVTQAWSVREGTNYVTQIECFDGGFAYANGEASKSFTKGTTLKEVYAYLISELPEVAAGVIGDYPGVLKRGIVLKGNTANILTELTGGGFFIDNEKANILGNNEYIKSSASPLVVSSASGLLGTPLLEQNVVRFDMIFEPELNIGYKIILDSITGLNFNGEYKVIGVKHRGVISESVSATMVTSGDFFYTKLLSGVS